MQGTRNNRSTKSFVRDSKTWEIVRRRRLGVCALITPNPFLCVRGGMAGVPVLDTQQIDVTVMRHARGAQRARDCRVIDA